MDIEEIVPTPAKGMTTLKTIGITVLFIAVAVVVGLVCWNLSAHFNRPVEEHKTYSIREDIVPVAKLATYDYNFTQILYYSSINAENPFRIEIPFSENKYIATIEGTTPIYTDTELIEFDPHYGVGDLLTGVDITLPHAQASQPVALDFDTLQILENRNGFLNDLTDDNKNNLLRETNTEQIEKINSSGVLDRADDRVKELIATQLKNIYGQDLKITFRFIDE